MIALTLGEIAELVGGDVEPASAADVVVTAPASVDSRHVAPGGLFVAAVGENVDGHDFVGAALAAGAAGSLVTRPVEGPHVVVDDVVAALGLLARAVVDRLVIDGDLQVVALTGSSGKTGTKDLLAQVLRELGTTVATAGEPQQRARRAADRARRRRVDAAPRARDGRAGGRATSPT